MAATRTNLKILHVIPAVAARYGGPSMAIFSMCQALQQQRIEPLIATTDADGPGRLPVALGYPVTYQNVPTIFFPRAWDEGLKHSPALARWLLANVQRFDLVHIAAIFSHSSLAAARACRRHSVPYIVRPLGSLAPWSLSRKRLRKGLMWHVGVKQMLHGAAAVHYTTTAERREAQERLRSRRGVVIPLGIDEAVLQTSTAPSLFRQRHPALGQHPYVLMLCRLHPKKGIELCIKAFLDIVQRTALQHWRLVVAGDGEASYVVNLQQIVRQRDGERKVLFTGWLAGDEKHAALQGAALFALPSYQENFALCVAEAMACGVPVMVSPHVNLADEIRTTGAGWVVDLKHADLCQALQDALVGEEQRVACGAAGRDLILSRFRWETVATKLSQLYYSIIETHRAAFSITTSSCHTDI